MNPTAILAQAAGDTVQSLLTTDTLLSNRLAPEIISAHRLHVDQWLSGSMLHPNFQPTPYSVIVGRGKETKENPGNTQLHALATTYLEQYSQAKNDKQIKTQIVLQVVSFVNEACSNGASFIKRAKNGQWYEVNNSIALEKVGYVFRDLLADKYRSSSKSKLARKNTNGVRLMQPMIRPCHLQQKILMDNVGTP
jgi:hypothetical protein